MLDISFGPVSKLSGPAFEENVNKFPFYFSFGPVAQLVERLICTEEVAGSNPVWSTKKTAFEAVF